MSLQKPKMRSGIKRVYIHDIDFVSEPETITIPIDAFEPNLAEFLKANHIAYELIFEDYFGTDVPFMYHFRGEDGMEGAVAVKCRVKSECLHEIAEELYEIPLWYIDEVKESCRHPVDFDATKMDWLPHYSEEPIPPMEFSEYVEIYGHTLDELIFNEELMEKYQKQYQECVDSYDPHMPYDFLINFEDDDPNIYHLLPEEYLDDFNEDT